MPSAKDAFLLLTLLTPALAAPASQTFNDITYAEPGGNPLQLDASIPEGPGPFPAAIVVHGGGWVRGDRRIDVAPILKPLTDARIAWFSISYRLATSAFDFGLAIHDVEDAIRFVKAHAAEYRIDPDRIALVGESAGGHLASMAALNRAPGAGVRAVVALYTPTDLVSLAKDSGLIPENIRRALKGSPFEGLVMARLAQLSPIELVRPGMPAFLFIHGTSDPLVPFEQSNAMCDKMKSVGATCEVFPVPDGVHGVRRWEPSPLQSGPYKRKMIDWLNDRLNGTAL
jgi:acetyl esterase